MKKRNFQNMGYKNQTLSKFEDFLENVPKKMGGFSTVDDVPIILIPALLLLAHWGNTWLRFGPDQLWFVIVGI